MNVTLLEQAKQLKETLVDFVYEAEGELAVALEKYAAENSNKERYDIKQQNLIIDTFITEGRVGEQTPLELFLENEPNLTQSDRALVNHWKRSFTGLFEIIQTIPNGLELMNWLSAKHYNVYPNARISEAEMARWQPGEILLTRIAPIGDRDWMIFSDCIPKGKLSQPKLAVAIGEFKKKHKEYLYSDAPELLEQAWESVARYHQEFVDFFGSDRITLSGSELNTKLAELQSKMSQKILASAGIDPSKSLKEVMQEAGANEEAIAEAAAELGTDAEAVTEAMNSQEKLAMVTPKVELPPEIKTAEQVTAFSHPKWGQMFIPTYTKFQAMLEAEDPQSQENCAFLVRKYLEEPQINFFIWQQLKEQYPTQLEKVLQTVLERRDFNLDRDLEATLKKFNKLPETELPETASVPRHLHDLFEEAVVQVSKSKSKGKKRQKTAKGFK